MASSRDTEVSYVFPGAANSLFTQHLLGGLRGGVPGPGGVVRIFDLFHHIQSKVTEECPAQHPIFKAEVEENFPIALYLGGKRGPVSPPQVPDHDPSLDTTGPSNEPRRIMGQLHLLLGIDDRLSERQRKVLLAALSLLFPEAEHHKFAENLLAMAPDLVGEVREIVEIGHDSSKPSLFPCRHPDTELLTALARIGLRLNLCRTGLGRTRPDVNSWTVNNWLAYLTDQIVCERGLLRFHLTAPATMWVYRDLRSGCSVSGTCQRPRPFLRNRKRMQEFWWMRSSTFSGDMDYSPTA